MSIYLSVHGILKHTSVNGPGLRFGIWVQGCHFHCDGCQNQLALPFEGGTEMSISEILSMIPHDVEGITISGGEPFAYQHFFAVSNLLKQCHSENFSTVVYSGFLFEEINKTAELWLSNKKIEFTPLDYIDILIDGRFEKNKIATDGWRGSTNQRVLPLTNRYKDICENLPTNNFEIGILSNGEIAMSGFPPIKMSNLINKIKEDKGAGRNIL